MGESNTNPDTTYPSITWEAAWPQRFEWGFMLFGVLSAACGVGMVGLAWFAEGEVGLFGFLAAGAVFLCMSWLALRFAGFRWTQLSRNASRCSSVQHGHGVRIGPEGVVLKVLVAAMVTSALYFTAIALSFWLQLEPMLPQLRDNQSNAVFAVICAAVSAVITLLLSVFRPSTALEIYPEVIVRTVGQQPFFRIGDDVTLPWSSILEVSREVRLHGGALWTMRDPLIRLVTREPVPKAARLGWDTESYLQLPVGWMAAEPNTLLAVLRAMHEETPSGRRKLLSAGPAGLLTPPPLRERFRASGKQAQ